MKRAELAANAAMGILVAMVLAPAWAQGRAADAAAVFPEKPIRLLVPFAPGGNTDILARAVGRRMNEHWGKPWWSTTARAVLGSSPPKS